MLSLLTNPLLIIGGLLLLIIAGIVIAVGFRSPDAADPLKSRLADYGTRDEPPSLQEIELSQPFAERVILPIIRRAGQFAARFTPEATLEHARTTLERAGNPGNLGPTEFIAIRIVLGVVLGIGMFLLLSVSSFAGKWGQIVGLAGFSGFFGYYMPQMLMSSRYTRRKNETQKALPDALDLITICVEAGLGFDGAIGKVADKWDNELAAAFGRVIQEINLGKTRQRALRDMAERMDVPDLTSFIAAVLQADQLGVSMGRVLRIQSDQMRVRRRQIAEEKAQRAPVQMLFPMAGCIFPAIFLTLMGPAVFILLNSGALSVFGY